MMDIRKIRCTVPCWVEDAKSGCHCAEARDEITRLRERTEYWPDNAERDAVIRHQKAEIKRLRADLAARDAEVARLRAALERLVRARDELEAHGDTPVYQALKKGAWDEARAALEEGRT